MLRKISRWPERLIALVPQVDQPGYSSVVIEYLVPKEQGWAFRRWHRKLIGTARRSEGFVRADCHRPLRCGDGAVKWYAVIHFDRPDHLDQWISCRDREALLEAGRSIFETYKFKSFATGLEGWFSHQSGAELTSLGPPIWKQILSVVLGLYPIIMIQDYVFESLDLLDSWSPASAMLIKNLVTTCILTLFVMPLIARRLDFWLRPAHQGSPLNIEITGSVFVVAIMSLMVFIFNGVA